MKIFSFVRKCLHFVFPFTPRSFCMYTNVSVKFSKNIFDLNIFSHVFPQFSDIHYMKIYSFIRKYLFFFPFIPKYFHIYANIYVQLSNKRFNLNISHIFLIFFRNMLHENLQFDQNMSPLCFSIYP